MKSEKNLSIRFRPIGFHTSKSMGQIKARNFEIPYKYVDEAAVLIKYYLAYYHGVRDILKKVC